MFLSRGFFVHWKSIFFLPTFKEFGVNSIYKYASTRRLKSKTFALQYLGQKSSKLSPKPLVRKLILWVVVAIFGCGNIPDQRLLFDHKHLCIWPLELSKHYEPGNHSKNQRLKPLRNSLKVSRAKFVDMLSSELVLFFTEPKLNASFQRRRSKNLGNEQGTIATTCCQ